MVEFLRLGHERHGKPSYVLCRASEEMLLGCKVSELLLHWMNETLYYLGMCFPTDEINPSGCYTCSCGEVAASHPQIQDRQDR